MSDFYSIKLAHYQELYREKFPKSPKSILEIGVNQGGSLHWLRRSFPGAHIAGIDIDPRCKGAEADGIKVFIGSQTDKRFLLETISRIPAPDVIIDDGGHRPYQQLASFRHLFPAMPDGGVYCCEDMIVGYEPRWRVWQALLGGFMPHMRKLIDRMNQDPLCCIHSVEFHAWMVFVRKGCNSFKLHATGEDDARSNCRNHET